MNDLYKILGILPNSEHVDIKRAYKTLMRKYHPDVFKGHKATADKKAKDINAAYQTLSDPAKRAAYDDQQRHWATTYATGENVEQKNPAPASEAERTAQDAKQDPHAPPPNTKPSYWNSKKLRRVLAFTMTVAGIGWLAIYYRQAISSVIAPPPVPSKVTLNPTHLNSDGIDVVTEYYEALARADGTDAALLVVPEKRFQGPLSAANATRFYSSLRGAIQLHIVRLSADNSIIAQYSYVSATGEQCDDTSDLRLVTREQAHLIDQITTTEKCDSAAPAVTRSY